MEKTINFRISEENKQELQFIAEEREIKLSYLIREIITEFIEDYGKCKRSFTMYSEIPIEVILDEPSIYNFNQ